MQDVNITEARARLGELADQVKYTGEPVMLTKNGKPIAAMVPLHVYERWARRRNGLQALVAEIRTRVAEAGLTEDEVSMLVDKTVQEVRNSKTSTPAPLAEGASR